MKKRKLIFEKFIDEALSTPDDLHEIVDGHVVAKNPNAQALGKLGGQATKKKYGKEHYQKLAKNMNDKRWGKIECKESPSGKHNFVECDEWGGTCSWCGKTE